MNLHLELLKDHHALSNETTFLFGKRFRNIDLKDIRKKKKDEFIVDEMLIKVGSEYI